MNKILEIDYRVITLGEGLIEGIAPFDPSLSIEQIIDKSLDREHLITDFIRQHRLTIGDVIRVMVEKIK